MKYYQAVMEGADGSPSQPQEEVSAKTAIDSTVTGNEQVKSEIPQSWPDDWQAKLSKGDAKRGNVFSRFTSPEALADAYIAAQQKISSGELKASLPKDAKPEEIANWRKNNGIPESPEKYDLNFNSGLVIGDVDKPIIDEFLKTAHGSNFTQDQTKAAIEWYFNNQKSQQEALMSQDDNHRAETLDTLNAEWGSGFRRNINMIEGLLNKFPESVRDSMKSARFPDGKAVFNDPDVLRAFAALALEINPVATLVPSGTGDPAKGIQERIESIEKTMRENRTAYNRDEKMQSEYRELLEAREKMKARSGNQ